MRTIELHEIRIGNYWSSNLAEGWVSQIDADDFMNIHVNGSDGWYPIPLTEKWLEDFGFEKRNGSFYKLRFLIESGIDILNDSWSFRITINNTDSCHCSSIKYVHNLQNLYFALTGTDLTIKNT